MPGAVTRMYHHGQYSRSDLVAAKRGLTVSLCIPARDEEQTVGAIVAVGRAMPGLVDEVIVMDDGSTDGTAAAAAGARVVSTDSVIDSDRGGKGDTLWKSLFVATGDVIVWCDADVSNFGPHYLLGLLGPLLTVDDVGFVKAFYERPLDGVPGEGGRVTELVARPLVAELLPQLVPILQPLAGEYAGRREVLEQLPFARGWGVEIGLLADIAARFGIGSIAQVDLGTRVHRNRPLADLAPQAAEIVRTILAKAGLRPAIDERPPMVEVPAYRATA